LITFSHRVSLATTLTADRSAIRSAVHAAGASGATALRDAVYTGLAMSGREHSRSLVLAFSDGLDNASWLSDAVVQRAAERSDAVVYGVAVAETPGMGGRRARYARGQTDFLQAIATGTGGRLLRADVADVASAFGEVLDEFRTRYLITYSPARVATPGWHSIALTVKGRRAVITARRGYQR
jgi:VWFA-related protein